MLRKHEVSAAIALAHRFLRPGDGVIDVGAAEGEYAMCWADQVGRSGYVLAVEPHRESARRLRDVSRGRPWVTCVEAAVGAHAGTAAFYPHPLPKQSSLYAANGDANGESLVYSVLMTTLDALVASMVWPPSLIKVDAQGAEAAILSGAGDTLRLPVVWILELWPGGLAVAGATVADVLAPFEAGGYHAADVYGRPIGWTDARESAARQTGASSVDILLMPETRVVRQVA